MQRYYAKKIGDEIFLDKGDIFHITYVMRLKKGSNIEICYGGKVYLAEITAENLFSIKIVKEIEENHELPVYVRLLYCVPKGDKSDFVVQKCCELGVSEIVFVNSSRCVAKIDRTNKDKKITRFKKIAKEACEQSKRKEEVKIEDVIDFYEIKKYEADASFIAYEKEMGSQNFLTNYLTKFKPKTINILIGCEGGFSEEEFKFANEAGFASISLGKRILRSETACIYLMSIISFLSEEYYASIV